MHQTPTPPDLQKSDRVSESPSSPLTTGTAGLANGQVDLWEHAATLYHSFEWQDSAERFICLAKLIENQEAQALCLINCSLIRARMGDFAESLPSLEAAYEADPTNTLSVFLMGLVQWELGNPTEAEACLDWSLDRLGSGDHGYRLQNLDFVLERDNILHNLGAIILSSEHCADGMLSSNMVAIPADLLFEAPPRTSSTPTTTATTTLDRDDHDELTIPIGFPPVPPKDRRRVGRGLGGNHFGRKPQSPVGSTFSSIAHMTGSGIEDGILPIQASFPAPSVHQPVPIRKSPAGLVARDARPEPESTLDLALFIQEESRSGKSGPRADGLFSDLLPLANNNSAMSPRNARVPNHLRQIRELAAFIKREGREDVRWPSFAITQGDPVQSPSSMTFSVEYAREEPEIEANDPVVYGDRHMREQPEMKQVDQRNTYTKLVGPFPVEGMISFPQIAFEEDDTSTKAASPNFPPLGWEVHRFHNAQETADHDSSDLLLKQTKHFDTRYAVATPSSVLNASLPIESRIGQPQEDKAEPSDFSLAKLQVALSASSAEDSMESLASDDRRGLAQERALAALEGRPPAIKPTSHNRRSRTARGTSKGTATRDFHPQPCHLSSSHRHVFESVRSDEYFRRNASRKDLSPLHAETLVEALPLGPPRPARSRDLLEAAAALGSGTTKSKSKERRRIKTVSSSAFFDWMRHPRSGQ